MCRPCLADLATVVRLRLTEHVLLRLLDLVLSGACVVPGTVTGSVRMVVPLLQISRMKIFFYLTPVVQFLCLLRKLPHLHQILR
jgi:hypothetical protein